MDNKKEETANLSSLISKLRSAFSSDFEPPSHPEAAVAVILRTNTQNQELEMLLIKRRKREGDPWSGHMAFPGGRTSSQDANPLSTAIREVKEEVGLDLSRFSVLGAMQQVRARNLGIVVNPYVVLLEGDSTITAEPREVESYVWVPLSFFQNRKNQVPYQVPILGGSPQEVSSYRFAEDQIIWGLTLRIIEQLISKVV